MRVRVRDLLRVPFLSRCPPHSHLLFLFFHLLGVNPPYGRVPVSPLGPELCRTVGLEAAGAGNRDDAPLPPPPPPALLLLLMVILLSRSCVQRCEKLSGKNKL